MGEMDESVKPNESMTQWKLEMWNWEIAIVLGGGERLKKKAPVGGMGNHWFGA